VCNNETQNTVVFGNAVMLEINAVLSFFQYRPVLLARHSVVLLTIVKCWLKCLYEVYPLTNSKSGGI